MWHLRLPLSVVLMPKVRVWSNARPVTHPGPYHHEPTILAARFFWTAAFRTVREEAHGLFAGLATLNRMNSLTNSKSSP